MTATDPSLWDAGEAIRDADTDAENGLTSEEAARRLADHGPNRLDAKAAVPAWRKLLAKERANGRPADDDSAAPFELMLADGSIHPHPGSLSFVDRAVDLEEGEQ